MSNTKTQYEYVTKKCRNLFVDKNKDYGAPWRILRISSLIDQLYIKAKRIRTIEELKEQKIDDNIISEYIGLLNYSIMGLINLENDKELNEKDIINLYDEYLEKSYNLMINKNHDYGEAWRNMKISSFTDLILMKIYRVNKILEHDGKTIVSEGIDANFYDIINYSVFALIKIKENEEK